MADSPKTREAQAELKIINQANNLMLDYPINAKAEIKTNLWQWLTIDDNQSLSQYHEIEKYQNIIVNFDWWLLHKNDSTFADLAESGKATIGFLPDDNLINHQVEVFEEIKQIHPDSPLAIYFPKFADGRGYSHCATLRARYCDAIKQSANHKKRSIWAFGDILVDQVIHMARVGFDGMVLRADQDSEIALKQLSLYSIRMQDDWRNPRTFLEKN